MSNIYKLTQSEAVPHPITRTAFVQRGELFFGSKEKAIAVMIEAAFETGADSVEDPDSNPIGPCAAKVKATERLDRFDSFDLYTIVDDAVRLNLRIESIVLQ